jgi:hypothetical protein
MARQINKEMKMQFFLKLPLLTTIVVVSMAMTSSASADVLCKAAPNLAGECSTSAGDYSGVTNFFAGGNAKFTIVGGVVSSVSCGATETWFVNLGTGSNTSGSSVSVRVEEITYHLCVASNGSTCTVTEWHWGYSGSVRATNDEGDGTFVLTSTIPETVVDCSSFGLAFRCAYKPTTSGFDWSLTGGNPATITASEQPLALQTGGFGCGSSAKWDASFKLTGSKTALWVATKNA